MNEKRLVLSSSERMCMGVAGGIAEYFNIDVTLVRLFFVLGVVSGYVQKSVTVGDGRKLSGV